MVKRAFDVIVTSLGLVLLAPLLILIAVGVKLSDRGPVLYHAHRTGFEGRVFTLFKFRTMAPGADRAGPPITAAGDLRVTPFGKLLRRTKLDELPQLVNVLRGDMSLVGPRPEDPRYVREYTAAQREVLSVRPGITSPASLRFRHEEKLLGGEEWERVYLEDVLPKKLALERDYIHHRSTFSDLSIIVRTVFSLLR